MFHCDVLFERFCIARTLCCDGRQVSSGVLVFLNGLEQRFKVSGSKTLKTQGKTWYTHSFTNVKDIQNIFNHLSGSAELDLPNGKLV